jgi:hypothetical protein
VFDDATTFNIIQYFANLRGGVFVMIQKGNEIRDRALKVDVVFPERVVGVDQEVLGLERCVHFGLAVSR